MLTLVKPDLMYYEQYNEMMAEWLADGSRIAPWFLDAPCKSIEEFAALVRRLDDVEKSMVEPQFCASSSYFAVNENGQLIGAARLAHYLTVEGLHTWGHIGYGVRPSERRKGYATEILRLTMEAGTREHHIHRFLLGAYAENISSIKTIEACGGTFFQTVLDPANGRSIRQYWIESRDVLR